MDAADSYRAADGNKKTTQEGEVKYQARPSEKNPELLDPRTVTKDDVKQLLEDVKEGMYAENSYIPIRISTPGIIQERLFAEDLPMAMPVKKIRQAYKPDNGPIPGKNVRGHALTVEDVLYIAENIDSPDYLFDQPNGRGVAVLKFPDSSENIAAFVDFSQNENRAYMNGYEGGLYNIAITAYDIDGGDVGLFMYQIDQKWRKVFDKKKEGDPAKKFQATRPFAIEQDSLEENVSQARPDVNPESTEKRSDRDPTAAATAQELEKQGKALEADVEDLVKMLRLRGNVTRKDSNILSAARYLSAYHGVIGKQDPKIHKELAGLLKEFYSYLDTGKDLSWERIAEKAKPVAEWIFKHTEAGRQKSEYARNVLADIRSKQIRLTEEERTQAAEEHGGYGAKRPLLNGLSRGLF